jgi:hypothetical protein
MNDQDLMGAAFEPQQWAIETMLPEGLVILAGKPKSGKSFLALNLAVSVADGSPALGRFPVTVGDVLFLGLEDSLRRMQLRLRRVMRGRDAVPSGRLHIETEWPTADEGGLRQLDDWLSDFEGQARLVVIDVLGRFVTTGGGSYRKDTARIAALDALAQRHHVCILVLEHMWKGGVSATMPDWLDRVRGTTGITASASGIIGLARERGSDTGLLRITGRDVPEADLPLQFSASQGTWIAGESTEITAPISDERTRILKVIETHPGATAVETAAVLGVSYEACRRLLWSMQAQDQLKRLSGRYFTPEQARAADIPVDPQLSFGEKPVIEFVPAIAGQSPKLTIVTSNRSSNHSSALR